MNLSSELRWWHRYVVTPYLVGMVLGFSGFHGYRAVAAEPPPELIFEYNTPQGLKKIEPTCELTGAALAFIDVERLHLAQRLTEEQHHDAHKVVLTQLLLSLNAFEGELQTWRFQKGCAGATAPV